MKKGLKFFSIFVPFVLALLIINRLFDIVYIPKIEGLPLLLPMFLCPITAIIAFITYYLDRDKLSLFGIIFNILLFIAFPYGHYIVVLLLKGPWIRHKKRDWLISFFICNYLLLLPVRELLRLNFLSFSRILEEGKKLKLREIQNYQQSVSMFQLK